jgi:hypothetical protein
MEQGLSQGSLRNSHRETHAVRRKPAPAKLQQSASALVESCSQDLVIRQRLDPDRVEVPIKKGEFFVLGNEGKADPGFLVFMKGEPAVFVQNRRTAHGNRQTASTMRLRVSAAMGEGTVLVATMDDVLHSLRLEDVWMWRNTPMTDQPYSERRRFLKEFVEKHWIPDARLLGGIYTSVAQPMSMEAFASKQDWSQFHSIEFVPEQAGRRRLVHFLEVQQRAATGPAAEKKERGLVAAPRPVVTTAPSKPATTDALRVVRAVPVDKMPDIYDLFHTDSTPLGRASVQQFALSMKMREMGECWVNARWVAEFGGYEIVSLKD